MRSFAKSAPEDRQVVEYFESELISDSVMTLEVETAKARRRQVLEWIRTRLDEEELWEFYTGIYNPAPINPKKRLRKFIRVLNELRLLRYQNQI